MKKRKRTRKKRKGIAQTVLRQDVYLDKSVNLVVSRSKELPIGKQLQNGQVLCNIGKKSSEKILLNKFVVSWTRGWAPFLTTLTRDVQCVSLLRMRQSVIICTVCRNAELWKLHPLFLGNRLKSATPDTKNH